MPKRARTRRLTSIVLIVVCALLLGCGPAVREIRFGVLTDQPGVAFQDSITVRSGFDIEMYRWMADNTEPNFDYVETDLTVGQRETMLQTKEVDVVVSSYSMSDYRRTLVGFAGPYLITYQGVMVRADGELRGIRMADQLKDSTACAQENSTSAAALNELEGVTVKEPVGFQECVDMLLKGDVDAVSTDQVILQGLVNNNLELRGQLIVPPTATFGPPEEYGIGLPLGDEEACLEWKERIREFLNSSEWDTFYKKNFGVAAISGTKPEASSLTPCPGEIGQG